MSDPQNANLEKGDKVTISADQTPATITEKLPEGDVGSASDPAVLVSREGQEGAGELKNASEVRKVNGSGGDVEMKDADAQGGGEDKTKEGKPAEVGQKRGVSEVDDDREVETKRAKVDEGAAQPAPAPAPAPAEGQEQPAPEKEAEAPKNRRSSRIKKEVAAPPAKEGTKKAAAGGGKKRGPGRPKKTQGGEEVKGGEEKPGEENGVKGGGEAAEGGAEKANGHEGQNGYDHAEGANGKEAKPAGAGAEPASVQVN